MPDEKPKAPTAEVKVNFRIPARMPSLYAHHMFVQPIQNEVVLSFFEIVPPPPLVGVSPDVQLKALQESGVVADCVARITIAAPMFPVFVKAMNDALEQTTSSVEEKTDADNTRNNPEG